MRVRDLTAMLAEMNPHDELVLEISPEMATYLKTESDRDEPDWGPPVLMTVEAVETVRKDDPRVHPQSNSGRIVALRPVWDVSPSALEVDDERRDSDWERTCARLDAESSARRAVRAERDSIDAALVAMRKRTAV